MKKSLLLLSAGLIAVFANAQETSRSLVFTGNAANNQVAGSRVEAQQLVSPHTNVSRTATVGARTTTGGSRWYDYIDAILANETSAPCVPVTATSGTGLSIWQDTSSILGYSGTPAYGNNPFTSLGLNLDPFFPGWNDPTAFPGVIAISSSNAYTIDSVAAYGWYNRSYATAHKIAVVDTLVLTFIQGNGTTGSNNPPGGVSLSPIFTSGYCIPTGGSLDYIQMAHDSLNNRAGNISGTSVVPVPTTQVYKFLLTSSDTNNSNFAHGMQFPRPGHVPADPTISFPVSAGNLMSMSVSFISGDGHSSPGGLYPAWPAQDTVRYAPGTSYKYGNWEGTIIFSATTSGGTVANWPPYNYPTDRTSGYYKKEGSPSWGGAYLPNWAWYDATTLGASSLQYPYISYHVQCPTCSLTGTPSLGVSNVNNINTISVNPNPANNELTVSYTGASKASVSVSLTNMIGQVVATKTVTNGVAVFNTSALPAGVYIYALEANGQRETGRVVVAH